MEDSPRDASSGNDCVITVYDGAWMTCDMIEETLEN